MQKRIIYISVLSALLTACGGGGSFDTPTSTPSDKKDNDGTAVIDPSLIKTGKEDKTGTESPSKDEKKKQGEVEKVKAEAEKAKAEAEKAKAEAEKNKKDESNTQQPPATETPKVAFKVATQEQIEAHNKLGEDSGSDGDTIDNSQVEYGHTQPAPISGYLYYKEDGRPDYIRERYKVDPAQAQTDSTENYDTIAFTNTKPRDSDNLKQDPTKDININKTYWKEKAGALNINDWGSDYNLTFSEDVSDDIKNATSYLYANKKDAVAGVNTLKIFELENTKIGMVSEEVGNDGYANIFYKVKNPSTLIPSAGTATYQGLWDLVRDLSGEKADLQQTSIGYGNPRQFSAATFEVDFSNKSLTGKLAPRTSEILGQDRDFAYNISANIQGNRFTGNATPSNTEAGYKNELRNAEVKGGFFGEQASELAGTIQNTEKTTEATKEKPGFFGVFAAKRTSDKGLVEGKEKPKTQYSQGKAILTATEGQEIFTENFTDILDGTNKLENINKITINGQDINLLDLDKNSVFVNADTLPLQFTRIGTVSSEAFKGNDGQYGYFYQGQLTQDVPTSGNATYHGSWIGNGKSSNKNIATTFSMTKDRDGKIEFVADFDKKTLDGQFKTETGNEAMTLKGVTFDGNTFKGQATITANGLSTNKTGSREFIKGTVEVSGAFFGPQANELGGEFHKEDKNFAGVFAGKQIQK